MNINTTLKKHLKNGILEALKMRLKGGGTLLYGRNEVL